MIPEEYLSANASNDADIQTPQTTYTIPETGNIAADMQTFVANVLNSDSNISAYVTFYPENALDIDFQIRKSLDKQGMAAIVMTPTLTYQGRSLSASAWTIEELVLEVTENPTVNRGRHDAKTALDIAIKAVDDLGGPTSPYFGKITPVKVEQGEDSGLLVAKATLACTVFAEK